MSYEYILKFIVVGEISVGKSALLTRFVGKEFEEGYGNTVGVEFVSQVCEINKEPVKLQI